MVRVLKKDALENFAELLEQAARGEEVIIEDENGLHFKLIATKEPAPRPKPTFGSARNSVGWMSDDFDEPLDDFAEYME